MAVDNYGNQIYPGSEDGGATDTEYTPRPERVICAGDERHADHEARIAALEEWSLRVDRHRNQMHADSAEQVKRIAAIEKDILSLSGYAQRSIARPEATVHTLLNAELHAPEADYAHIPIAVATWEAVCDELEAARAADVPMLRRMIDSQHKVASERIEEIVRLSSELRDLRAKWESVPWQALLWSVSGAASVYAAPAEDINTALDWIRAEAPKEATE